MWVFGDSDGEWVIEPEGVGSVLVNWQLVLGAGLAGVALGVLTLAGLYLAPLVRLRLATDEESRARVLREELGRVRRLGDAAAVHEEHDLDGAGELREEVEIRALLLAWGAGPRGTGYQLRS